MIYAYAAYLRLHGIKKENKPINKLLIISAAGCLAFGTYAAEYAYTGSGDTSFANGILHSDFLKTKKGTRP